MFLIILFCMERMKANGLALAAVGDFEELHFQAALNLNRSPNAKFARHPA
jgi:hypothetical protein